MVTTPISVIGSALIMTQQTLPRSAMWCLAFPTNKNNKSISTHHAVHHRPKHVKAVMVQLYTLYRQILQVLLFNLWFRVHRWGSGHDFRFRLPGSPRWWRHLTGNRRNARYIRLIFVVYIDVRGIRRAEIRRKCISSSNRIHLQRWMNFDSNLCRRSGIKPILCG